MSDYPTRVFIGGPLHHQSFPVYYQQMYYDHAYPYTPRAVKEDLGIQPNQPVTHRYCLYQRIFYSEEYTWHQGEPMMEAEHKWIGRKYEGVEMLEKLSILISRSLQAHGFREPLVLFSAYEHVMFVESEDIHYRYLLPMYPLVPERVSDISHMISDRFIEARYQRAMG